MSIWSYISGSLGVDLSPYRVKLNKDGSYKCYKNGKYNGWPMTFLPFPEEQFSLGVPEPYTFINSWGKEDAGIKYKLNISSLPVIKRIVDKACEVLPSGEHAVIEHSCYGAEFSQASGSLISSPEVEKLFQQAVMEKHPEPGHTNWKDYHNYGNVKPSWVEEFSEAIITIHSSIRYDAACYVYRQLIEFFNILKKEKMYFDFGSFNIYDWDSNYSIIVNSGCIETTITFNGKDTKEYFVLETREGFAGYNTFIKVNSFEEYNKELEAWDAQKRGAEVK